MATEMHVAKSKSMKGEGGKKVSELRIPIGAGTGHLVMHHHSSKDGNFYDSEPQAFSEDQGVEAVHHIAKMMGVSMPEPESAEEEKEAKGSEGKKKEPARGKKDVEGDD
jgi:hypothetical protein